MDSLDQTDRDVIELKNTLSAGAKESVADLEKMLEGDAKNAAVLSRLCNLTRTENPQKSLEYCRRASEIEPENINHAVGYGAALVQAKNYGAAVEILRRILQVAPDNFTARANLATALFQLKRFAEAKSEYLWLSEKQPELAAAYYFLAISHDNLGEYIDALANYQQFLRLADPQVSRLEIEKVNLRLPALQTIIKRNGGKNRRK